MLARGFRARPRGTRRGDERPLDGGGRRRRAREHSIAVIEVRYPDGTNVLCMATADLDGAGKITRQVAVTAWDE